MKRKLLSLLLCLCLVSSLMPGMAFAAGEQYDDVSGHWAESSIQRWSGYKVVQGSDGHFRPNASLTRGEMATILANALGLTDQGSSNPFSDVPADAWYAPYVLRCYTAGIMKGDGTTARPTATITRQEAMVMLGRALAIPEKTGADLSAYSDGASVADWAKGAVAAMTEAKIVNGVGDNLLAPGANINRASVVAILDRAVVQYINTPGTHTLVDKDGIVLVAAAGDVTLTGKTPADILVTPAAKGKTLAFDKATITGAVTVQADGMKVTKSDSSLPDIVTAGKDITVEDAKQPATPATPGGSSGGGNGGGSGTPSVTLTVSGSQGDKLAVGAKLTASVSNANGAILVWNVGGFDQEGAANEYPVTAADMGKVIFAKLVKDGEQVAKSSEYTVTSSAPLDTSEAGKNTAPVVLGNGVAFKNDAGDVITVDTTSLVLSIEEKKDITEDQKTATKTAVTADMTTSITTAITGGDSNVTLTQEETTAITNAIAAAEVKAVDVDLTMVTETTNETTGATTTQETPVHPVGQTTVKLSAAQLGMAGEDLNLYHFVASHTNKANVAQTVTGTVDEKGETVTFVTNGLSTIWIGNVPPRTVTFDTKGGSAVAAQKVKFGSRVNTREVGTPTKAGFLFCGWNRDLTTTPIISNLTVEAKWIEGTKIPAARYTVALSASGSLTTNAAEGKFTITADPEASYTASITASASVTPYTSATQYVVSASAETAASTIDPAQFTQIASAASIPMTSSITVTNGEAKVMAGKTSYYIKWMDAQGNVLALEELIVIVDDGQGAAESKTVTQTVNRGLGQFEPYLTSSTKADAPKWVGSINGNIRKNSSAAYDLEFGVGFEEHFNGTYNSETENTEYDYTSKDYDTLTLEFTPFSGESFTSKTVSAKFEYYNGTDWTETSCTPVKADNKLTITFDTKTLSTATTNAYLPELYLYLTVDGVISEIYFYDIPNPTYTGTINREQATETFTNMETLKTALATAENEKEKEWSISYAGAETEFIINESISIPVHCSLSFYKKNYNDSGISVTVANGATVTMNGTDDGSSSNIHCDGAFTVQTGGKVLSVSPGFNEYSAIRMAGIYANQIIVKSGGSIDLSDNGILCLFPSGSNSSCTLESGSTVTNNGQYFEIRGFETANLDGQINVGSSGQLALYNDNNRISGTVSVNSSGNSWRGAEFYGTTTITSTGKVNAAGACEDYTMEFNGPLDNQGTITISSSAKATISNLGYASQSSGRIEVAGALMLNGTKLTNTGAITGSGTITGALGDDTTSYDDGLDFLNVDSSNETPSDYSRSKFTKDPDKTVEVILYKSSLVNESGGTCSITPTFADFPAN